nr:basic proline-rich protein-like [Cavia porcellus]
MRVNRAAGPLLLQRAIRRKEGFGPPRAAPTLPGTASPSSPVPQSPARQHPRGTHLRLLSGRRPATSPATLSRPPSRPATREEAALQPEPGPRSAPRQPADPPCARRRLNPPPLPGARSRPAPSTQPGSEPPPEVPLGAVRPDPETPPPPATATLQQQMGRRWWREKSRERGSGREGSSQSLGIERSYPPDAGHPGKGSLAQPSEWTTTPTVLLEERARRELWPPRPGKW